MHMNLKYLIIGAGGTGGGITAYLAKAGKDVTVIARGTHLAAMQENGLRVIRPADEFTVPVKAMTEAEYQEQADIIFVCVKGYSLDSVYDLIRRASHEKTIVIPILNIYGTGEVMQEKLPGILVLNGCIYIAAEIECPGTIRMKGMILRVVFGRLAEDGRHPVLLQVEKDLADSGITPVYSTNIRRDTLEKFAFVSPMAAAGAYGDWMAKDFKQEGEARNLFLACAGEILAVADKMGIVFEKDILETDLKILDGLADTSTASMQRDLKKGGSSEKDGLVREVVRMGEKYGVPTPAYQMIAEKLGC